LTTGVTAEPNTGNIFFKFYKNILT
jgi:hypothetical protein